MKLKNLGFINLAMLSALCLLVVSGESRATSILPPANTTTIIGTNVTVSQGESFLVGRWDLPGAILNQTGGVITVTATWGNYGVGNVPGGWGVYTMSGAAGLIATNLSGVDGGAGIYHIQGFSGSRLIMSNNATANIAALSLEANVGSPAKIQLSDSASLTVGNKGAGLTVGTGSYIDFVSGSSATLTLTGTNNFTNLVSAGSIRLDGSAVSLNQFQISSNTLSLMPPFPGLDHFVITGISSPTTSGVPVSVTLTAKQSDDNTLTTFTNSVDFAGTAGITGTSSNFVAGVLTGVSVTPAVAGTGKTFIVIGGGKSGTSTFDVSPDPAVLDHFTVTGISSPLTAGTPVSITVTAKNAYSNTLTSYIGTVAYSGTAGITGTSDVFTAGVLSGASVTPITAGSGKTLIVTGSGKTGTNTFNVVAGAASKLGFSVQPSGTSIGVAISPAVSVQVQDANGNIVTGDTSIVTISSATTAFTNSILATNAIAGLATFSTIKPTTAGSSNTLVASAGSLAGATSGYFIVAADYVANWYIGGTQTWTSTSGVNSNGQRTVGSGGFIVGANGTGVLLQTGGTITSLAQLTVGQNVGTGGYYMSGAAQVIAPNMTLGQPNSIMSLSNSASATISGAVNFAANSQILLSGAASFTAGSLTSLNSASKYISFVSGSAASLTLTGAHDYTSLVTNGYIRVDGAVVAMSQFYVSGNTLSLLAPPTGVTARGTESGGVAVEWVSSATANGYLVYRSTTNNGTGYGLVGGTSGQAATNYTDHTAHYMITYYYAVSGTNSSGESVKSAPSSAVMLLNSGTMISIF